MVIEVRPTPDPRLTSTWYPDPGVIEVNIAPTASLQNSSWKPSQQARLARLYQKFDVDGATAAPAAQPSRWRHTRGLTAAAPAPTPLVHC